jgi:hypothetical protein
MENEFQTEEKNTLKKHIGLIALLLVLLIIGIVFTSYYTTFLNREAPVETAEKSVRQQVEEDYGAYLEAFWNENDHDAARMILQEAVKKFETDDAYAGESSAEGRTEADLKINLAEVTVDTNPENGLRLYAEVYLDPRFSITERANALFMAMQHVADGGIADAELATAKEWVFGANSFGPVLNEIEYSLDEITTPYELRTAAISGIRHAANITGSYRIRGYMLSEEFKLKADIEIAQIHETLTGEAGQAAPQTDVRLSLDDAQVERLDQLLTDTRVHYTDYMMTLVNNTEVFTTYNPEIIYGLRNLIQTLSSLQYLGYDVYSDLSIIYDTGVAHLNRYNPEAMGFSWRRNYELQTAALNFVTACGHVLAEPALSEDKIAEYVAPVLALNDETKNLLATYIPAADEQTNVCYGPTVYMGTYNQSFQDLLVNTIDGWTTEQLTLTE